MLKMIAKVNAHLDNKNKNMTLVVNIFNQRKLLSLITYQVQ